MLTAKQLCQVEQESSGHVDQAEALRCMLLRVDEELRAQCRAQLKKACIEVPELLYGAPYYDRHKLLEAVEKKLRRLGYTVSDGHRPYELCVDWHRAGTVNATTLTTSSLDDLSDVTVIEEEQQQQQQQQWCLCTRRERCFIA